MKNMYIFASELAGIVGLSRFNPDAWQKALDRNNGSPVVESDVDIAERKRVRGEIESLRKKQSLVSVTAIREYLVSVKTDEEKILEILADYDEPKLDELKPDEQKVDESKLDELKMDEQKVDEQKLDEPILTEQKPDEQKPDDIFAALDTEKNIRKVIGKNVAGLKEYGIVQEEHQLRKAPSRQKSLRKKIIDGWFLCGKIDAEKDGVIVEVKNRQSRLFYRAYDYERVQVMAYMWMSGSKKAYIEEHFDGLVNSILVEWDGDFWSDVMDKLLAKISEYRN